MGNSGLRYLPRLEHTRYQAFAAVHWTMTVEPRIPGWLDARFHQSFRELLLHACVRERLFCPVYCLMPDHLHMMWMGLSVQSDQLNGMKFCRRQLNLLLEGCGPGVFVDLGLGSSPNIWKLQPQAHDHVLREEERKRGALAHICFYILANPVRAGLVDRESTWPFSGTIIPGYPALHPMQEDFWELFWRLYSSQREPNP